MLGPRQETQNSLFYDFSIEGHVPPGHVLRAIDGVIDLSGVRQHLADDKNGVARWQQPVTPCKSHFPHFKLDLPAELCETAKGGLQMQALSAFYINHTSGMSL